MKAYLRPISFIMDDIKEKLESLKDKEELIIKIERDSVDKTYIYSQKNGDKK